MSSTQNKMRNTGAEPNQAQQQAVDIVDGPALVVAGAGTGKTSVITQRILQLLENSVQPESILALTFTEKAAGEMLDRVNANKVGVTLDTTIATFNGFGNDILQAYAGEWGLGQLRLLGSTGQLVFMREHLDEFELDYFSPVSNPEGQIEILKNYVSLLKQQLIQPSQYKKYAEDLPEGDAAEKLEKQKHQEIARFFGTYLELCRKEHVIDYDDQIYLTIELLIARPNILRQLQDRYSYILVDEFQDTNPMQSSLVDLLAKQKQNVMAVGDDDQSIYGWRGATLANILDFKDHYPKAQEITLIENYRSSQAILDHAYRLIQYNNPHRLEAMNKLDKHLKSNTDIGPAPTRQHFNTHDEELAWVAEDIKRRIKAGEDPSSIAVLTRRNQGVQKVHEALELYGIPHAVAGLNNDIYDQNAVRQLLETLKAVADPNDDMALFHALSGPLFDLDIGKLAEISGQASRNHESFNHLIASSSYKEAVSSLSQIESWRNDSREQTVGRLAYSIITDTGWKKSLHDEAERDTDVFNQVQALAKFFKTLKEFEQASGVASVQNYALNLPALKAAGSNFEDATLDISDTLVNVLSVHRSKGLEWNTVYIVDCTENSFPLSMFGSSLTLPTELQASHSQADEHIAEERRLMYVALTRAKREAILSHANRHGNGAKRKPSRFLTEMFDQEINDQTSNIKGSSSLELFSPSNNSSAIGLPSEILKDGHLTLSVSQIECWLRCPQDFYYKYVLKMPLPPAPHLEYGSLIHGIIERIYRDRQNANATDLKELTDHVIGNMPKAGYATKRSRDRAKDQAINTVKAVYERFSKEEIPTEIELPFKLKLYDIPLSIKGRIDAVYKINDGVEIRDFKTGTGVATADKAKSRATSSQQLTLYALAWMELRGEMPAKLTLDFVETGQAGSVKKQAKSLDTLQTKLQEMVEHLKAGKYPAGRDHKYCFHPEAE